MAELRSEHLGTHTHTKKKKKKKKKLLAATYV